MQRILNTYIQKAATVFWLVILTVAWFLLSCIGLNQLVSAQGNGSFPVAVTVPVSGVSSGGGELVIYRERTDSYSISTARGDPDVYGVTVLQPPVLFETASNTIPVVTQGAVYLNVNNSTGQVARGDLLVTAAERGTAAKALPEDENVIAIALEDAFGSASTILVQLDDQAARTLLEEREEKAKAAELAALGIGGDGSGSDGETEPQKGIFRQLVDDYSRAILAAIIAIGSLFFIMYTFRSTIVNATLAVGRNPRARNAIMTVSVENIVFAILICAIALFIAVAVLVLPV